MSYLVNCSGKILKGVADHNKSYKLLLDIFIFQNSHWNKSSNFVRFNIMITSENESLKQNWISFHRKVTFSSWDIQFFFFNFWTISPTSKDLTSWCLLGKETEYIFKYILGKVNQLVMKLEPVTYSHGKYFQKKFCQYALRWYFEGMH